MPERQAFRPDVIYRSAYKPPRGKAPDGYEWKCVRRHPEKGYPEEWQLQPKVRNEQPPSIDELPPLDVDGPLSETSPRNLGGITSQQLEDSAKRGGPMTHAAYVAQALEDKEDRSAD